jgi:hypothetical protein
MKSFFLKNLTLFLIETIGLEGINDLIAEVFFEEYLKSGNKLYDDLSEEYDILNRKYFNRRKK